MLTTHLQGGPDALPKLQMMEQKLKEVKELTLGHTAWKWWICHLSPGLSASKTQVTTQLLYCCSPITSSAAFCW